MSTERTTHLMKTWRDRALTAEAEVDQLRDTDRLRGTGGNRFIPADATAADLLGSINDQLGDLREWVDGTDRHLDLGEVTISTRRIKGGLISVSVTADLATTDAEGAEG